MKIPQRFTTAQNMHKITKEGKRKDTSDIDRGILRKGKNSDVPGTLLNLAFINMGSESETTRLGIF